MPKVGAKRPSPPIRHPELRRIRAMKMLERRTSGASLAQVGEEFNLSTDAVDDNLRWLVNEGYLLDAESTILERLVPKALQIYDEQLDLGNFDAASDVVKHLLKLHERHQAKTQHSEELSLKAYLELRRQQTSRTSEVTIDVIPEQVGQLDSGTEGQLDVLDTSDSSVYTSSSPEAGENPDASE